MISMADTRLSLLSVGRTDGRTTEEPGFPLSLQQAACRGNCL
jgi:hypothetical protein